MYSCILNKIRNSLSTYSSIEETKEVCSMINQLEITDEILTQLHYLLVETETSDYYVVNIPVYLRIYLRITTEYQQLAYFLVNLRKKILFKHYPSYFTDLNRIDLLRFLRRFHVFDCSDNIQRYYWANNLHFLLNLLGIKKNIEISEENINHLTDYYRFQLADCCGLKDLHQSIDNVVEDKQIY